MTTKITVSLANKGVTHLLELVNRLRAMGLVQGRDFDFMFLQSSYDPDHGHIESSAVFEFYTEKYASMFSMMI